MKWPWVWRFMLDASRQQVLDKQAVIDTQNQLIDRLKSENKSITALFSKESNFEVIDTQVDKVTLKLKPAAQTTNVTGRAGFRGAVAQRESRTVPPVGDSVTDLETRVAREGGKV